MADPTPPNEPGNGDAPQPPQRRQRLRSRVHRIVEASVANPQSQRRRVAVPVYALRLAMQVVRQWARDRCPQQAASLAFQTVLSIVPLLALSLALLRASGNLDAESELIQFIARAYLPFSQDEISKTLQSWSENITFQTLGVVGLITTMTLAFVMFNTLERVMNDIWRAERRRPLAQKFVVFYAVSTLLPVLLGLGLYQAARVGLTSGFAGFLASFATMWAGAFLVIYVLPRTRVHVRAALAGAAVATVLFEIAKELFGAYAENIAFDKFTGIYGAVALAPIALVWIYYSWLVLMLGAEVAYAAQHLHLLERRVTRENLSLNKELEQRVNGVVAARIMVAIADAYLSGKKVVSRRSLADRFDLSDEAVDRIGTRLKEHDLVMEVEGEHVGFMPARNPNEIALADILGAFRGDDVLDTTPHRHETTLDVVLREIEQETRNRTRNLFLDKLVDEFDGVEAHLPDDVNYDTPDDPDAP